MKLIFGVCLFFIGLGLAGCASVQPVFTTTTETTATIDNTQDLRNLFECDSNYQVTWSLAALALWQNDSLTILSDEQKKQIDSLKTLPKLPLKNKVTFIVKKITETKACSHKPCKPEIIIQKEYPKSIWGVLAVCFISILANIILIVKRK